MKVYSAGFNSPIRLGNKVDSYLCSDRGIAMEFNQGLLTVSLPPNRPICIPAANIAYMIPMEVEAVEAPKPSKKK